MLARLLDAGVDCTEQLPVQRMTSLGDFMGECCAASAQMAAQQAGEAHAIVASLAAMSAASAAAGRPVDAIMQAANTFMCAATVDSPIRGWLRCVRRDFEKLVSLAKKHGWTDDTPVPPDVFGPLWPENLTPPWATALPMPPA
jgi:hypothetical protein